MSRPSVRRVLRFAFILAALTRLHAQEPADAKPVPVPTPAPTAPPLSVEDCIARALEKNFTLKIQGFTTDMARETLIVAKANFDPTLSASTTRTWVQTSPNVRSDITDTRVGVDQNLTSGAVVSLSTAVDRSGYTPLVTPPNPVYNSDLALTITQPLLRGAGPAVNRAAIERSRLGVSIANLSYKGSVLQVVHDTETAYYNLVFARGQLAVKQHSLDLAQKLYEENKARRTTGVMTDLDVLTAEVGVANARNGIVTADQQVHNTEDALLALVGRMDFNVAIGPVTLPEYNEPPPTFDAAYKLARDNQPDFVSAQTAIKQFQIDAHTAKNAALPGLNLGGAVGYNGIDHSYASAINRLPDGDGRNWQLDLSLNLPWGLRADRARYRSALAGLRQEEARVQQIDQSLIVQVRAAVLAVTTNQESVGIFSKATELAGKQYDLELARFKAGLSTSRLVLESQDDLESARLNELQARVALRLALANLHQLDSTSLERFHIALAD